MENRKTLKKIKGENKTVSTTVEVLKKKSDLKKQLGTKPSLKDDEPDSLFGLLKKRLDSKLP